MMRSIDRTFRIFGFEFQIKIVPPGLSRIQSQIDGLINGEYFDLAAEKLNGAKKILGHDPVLNDLGVRLRFEKFKSDRSHRQ